MLGYLRCRINENILKSKCFKPRGVHILKHIKDGLRTKSKGLKVVLSQQVESMLGNLIEFKPVKMPRERIFFLNKNRFSEEMFQF